jgi:hypothetical protein
VEVTATHLAILSNALLGISDTNQPWNYVSTTATSDVELAVQQNTLMRYLAGAQDHPLSCCFLQPPYHDRKQRTHTPRGPCGRPGLRPRLHNSCNSGPQQMLVCTVEPLARDGEQLAVRFERATKTMPAMHATLPRSQRLTEQW